MPPGPGIPEIAAWTKRPAAITRRDTRRDLSHGACCRLCPVRGLSRETLSRGWMSPLVYNVQSPAVDLD
jgi:hypothetical protein